MTEPRTPPASAPGSGEELTTENALKLLVLMQAMLQNHGAAKAAGRFTPAHLTPDPTKVSETLGRIHVSLTAALARARAEVVTSLMDQLGVMSVQDDPRTMSANPTDWMAAGLDAIKQAARAEGEAKGRREALRWTLDNPPRMTLRPEKLGGWEITEPDEDYIARGLAALAEGGGE